MSDNGHDDTTPARPYRLTRHPEAMWFVRQLANYELALSEAIKDIRKIADAAADSESPPSAAHRSALSAAALDIASASLEFGYGISPETDRRKKRA
jgi:hypothetical protein